MQEYGWTLYDTRVGGSQTIYDKDLHMDLSTGFLKTEDGKGWAVHVTGTPRADAPRDVRTTVIFHIAVEKTDLSNTRTLSCSRQSPELTNLNNSEAACYGDIPALGSFEFHVLGDGQNNAAGSTSVKSLNVSEDQIWQAKRKFPAATPLTLCKRILTSITRKAVFVDQFKTRGGNGDERVVIGDEPGNGNLHYIQMTFDGPFALTYKFSETGGILLDRE